MPFVLTLCATHFGFEPDCEVGFEPLFFAPESSLARHALSGRMMN
jgi:hypothetical protein